VHPSREVVKFNANFGGLVDANNDTAFKAQNLEECSGDQVVASTFYEESRKLFGNGNIHSNVSI
jgi:hypothetical protein